MARDVLGGFQQLFLLVFCLGIQSGFCFFDFPAYSRSLNIAGRPSFFVISASFSLTADPPAVIL